MKFKENFFHNYLKQTPVPLALERSFECEILSKQNFKRPILDVGVGEGLFAFLLFDEKIEVGIDPNKKELERCSQFNMYEELIECYGNKIPKPDASFATIMSNSVMEHIEDIEPVLREIHRLLQDDGRVFFTLPTEKFNQNTVIYSILFGIGLKGLAKRFQKFYNNFWRHYHDYDVATWQKLFENNGFKVVQVQEYNPRKTCLLNDALVPFSFFSLVVKKITNKWFLVPPLRKIGAWIWYKMLNNTLKSNLNNTYKSGLVFFELRK